MQEPTFQLLIDGVTYHVYAEPLTINGELQYKVNYNQGTDFIFNWSDNAGRYTLKDADSAAVPLNVETAIAAQLARLSA